MNPGGQWRIPRPGMKPRLIPDDHMLRLDVAGRDLLEKPVALFQTDRREELELGQPFDHFHRAIHIFPFVALLLGQHHPLTPQRPAAPTLRVPPEPGLIGHPNLHRTMLGQVNPFSATGPRFDFFYGLSVRFSEGFWYS